jgi:glucokinase
MVKEFKQAIGIDLGGSKIDISLVNQSGTIHQQRRLETNVKGGPAAIEKQILEVIHEMISSTHGTVLGVGIGVAGQIDEKTGTVLFGPNLKWHNHPLQENLQNAIKLPVKVINDARAITLGEWLYGAGFGCDDLVCIFVGTGIGGGVVSGGKLLKGCSNTCGEIGHMTIDFHGPTCVCGNRGCLEAFAGGWAIAKQAQEAIKTADSPNKTLLELADNDINNVSAKLVIEAYHKGDALALFLMERFKQALVAGCVSIVNAFNPCRLILGGGVLSGLPEFLPLIESSIKRSALNAATVKLQVLPPKLNHDESGILGASAIIFNSIAEK